MKHILFVLLLAGILLSCNENSQKEPMKNTLISSETVTQTVDDLVKKFPKSNKKLIEKGVEQAASLWRKTDGDDAAFRDFCTENFVGDGEAKEVLFEKLSRNFEIINGNFTKMYYDLRMPLDLSGSEITPADIMFGSYNPSAHLQSDFYNNKIAFKVILNFPFYTLAEKNELGEKWSSKEWAYARLGDMYVSRVPAELNLRRSEIQTQGSTYISEYNIHMGNLVDESMNTHFPENMKLITHWGLRDEIKSNYSSTDNLNKQRMIYDVMQRIIMQEIPRDVINNGEYQWNPTSNELFKDGKKTDFQPEPDTRYQIMLDNFKITKESDQYNPAYPTYLLRKFERDLEISIDRIETLFTELISSPQVKETALIIEQRLGRELEPFDIWYDGFKERSTIPEELLDELTTTKYPNRDAFEADLPNILINLGFSSEMAHYICDKITVDASRGAGHAARAGMKGDKARLRTRISPDGMDYKGYNIAIHEFGHNVEQTISLYDVDYYTLNGIPNTGFTEALAFIFQKRDLTLLDSRFDAEDEHLAALDNLWSAYEIMGVSLVDIAVWKWLYENPDATAEELKEAVLEISKDIWNKYYAEVFGSEDEPILAVYSHMILYPLYLPAYPIGQIIEFQLEEHLEGKDFAEEVHRIYKQGRLTPEHWMLNAVGKELSTKPMLEANKAAIEAYKEL